MSRNSRDCQVLQVWTKVICALAIFWIKIFSLNVRVMAASFVYNVDWSYCFLAICCVSQLFLVSLFRLTSTPKHMPIINHYNFFRKIVKKLITTSSLLFCWYMTGYCTLERTTENQGSNTQTGMPQPVSTWMIYIEHRYAGDIWFKLSLTFLFFFLNSWYHHKHIFMAGFGVWIYSDEFIELNLVWVNYATVNVSSNCQVVCNAENKTYKEVMRTREAVLLIYI